MAIVVVLCTRIAEQRAVGGAIFRAGLLERVPTIFLREVASLCQCLKHMLADVIHPIRLCLLRAGELVNPDRLCDVVPPGSMLHCGTRKDAQTPAQKGRCAPLATSVRVANTGR